jgi:hypothetical protein
VRCRQSSPEHLASPDCLHPPAHLPAAQGRRREPFPAPSRSPSAGEPSRRRSHLRARPVVHREVDHPRRLVRWQARAIPDPARDRRPDDFGTRASSGAHRAPANAWGTGANDGPSRARQAGSRRDTTALRVHWRRLSWDGAERRPGGGRLDRSHFDDADERNSHGLEVGNLVMGRIRVPRYARRALMITPSVVMVHVRRPGEGKQHGTQHQGHYAHAPRHVPRRRLPVNVRSGPSAGACLWAAPNRPGPRIGI